MDNLSLSAETVSGWMLEMCNVYFKHIVCEYIYAITRILYLGSYFNVNCYITTLQLIHLLYSHPYDYSSNVPSQISP